MRWMAVYQHDRGGATFWNSTIVTADTPPDAAKACEHFVEDHAPTTGEMQGKLRVAIFGPIPEDPVGEWLVHSQIVAEELFSHD